MTLWGWGVAVFGLYIGAILLLYRFQDRFIFARHYAKKVLYETPKPLTYTLQAPDGTRLEGLWKKNGAKDLLLWFDGNSDNIRNIAPLLDRLDNVDVAGLNYRGYGESDGLPTQELLFEDALLLYDTLAPRYNQIYLLGRSLGTGVAAYLASKRPTGGLILITPYYSVRALAAVRFPLLSWGFLVRHPFESAKYLLGNSLPVAVLEVIGDRVIPNRHTQKLINSLQRVVLYERLSGCTHGTVEEDERFLPFVRRALETFPKSKEFS